MQYSAKNASSRGAGAHSLGAKPAGILGWRTHPNRRRRYRDRRGRRERREGTGVLAEERQNQILSMVNSRGSVSITEIQRKLKVSRETVRRDLLLLAERNRLRKTHGGALSLERNEPEIEVRKVTNVESKRAMGRLAASLVPDGASVILASGTTMQSVAD